MGSLPEGEVAEAATRETTDARSHRQPSSEGAYLEISFLFLFSPFFSIFPFDSWWRHAAKLAARTSFYARQPATLSVEQDQENGADATSRLTPVQ
jgi:hypothetical protein